jgi:hypothetical protein
MNYVKQAYALSDSKKQAALQLYKEAVVELVQKDYCMQVSDAHTELSAIFGTKWLFTQRESGMFWMDAKKYAEANVAFNYANFTLGISGRFTELAKSLVAESVRVSNGELKKMAKQMDSVLTATTEDRISLAM